MVPEQAKTANMDLEALNDGLGDTIPHLIELVERHEKNLECLSKVTKQLVTYSKQNMKGNISKNITKSFEIDKTTLGNAIKAGNVKTTLRIVQKVEEMTSLSKEQIPTKKILEKFKEDLEIMKKKDLMKNVTSIASRIATKFRMMRDNKYVKDWCCDRQYLTSKMTLSEDGLTYGNSATNGYPAIIGNIEFDNGLYAFEVTPIDLDCTGKEGFGIIEHEEYLEIFRNDSTTPAAYDKMIGFLYKDVAKNMTVETITSMQSGRKYFVRINRTVCMLHILAEALIDLRWVSGLGVKL